MISYPEHPVGLPAVFHKSWTQAPARKVRKQKVGRIRKTKRKSGIGIGIGIGTSQGASVP